MTEKNNHSNAGIARANALSPERRKEIATKASNARWLPKATHQGVLNIMEKELPCVVLDDGQRLLMQASVFKAFDRPQRGSRKSNTGSTKAPNFMDANNIKSLINQEDMYLIIPVEYLDFQLNVCTGYRAEIIPLVCNLYLVAREKNILTAGQMQLANISEQIVRALSLTGIVSLIDEATGYQEIRPRDALEAYLNKILSKELAAWCKRFPDAYYENIYKLRGWPKFSTSKNKFSCVGTFTNDLVYSRIGEDILAELKNRTPDTSKTRMHQWLTVDTGHPLLSKHLNEIITLQKVAIAQGLHWKKFMELVNQVLPKKSNALQDEPS